MKFSDNHKKSEPKNLNSSPKTHLGSTDALDACDTPPNVNEENPQNSFSYLWNAMMHPFTRHNVYGGLWYQGKLRTEH